MAVWDWNSGKVFFLQTGTKNWWRRKLPAVFITQSLKRQVSSISTCSSKKQQQKGLSMQSASKVDSSGMMELRD